MKILFLGNFEAEFSSENYYRLTLEKLGHEVLKAQEGKTSGDALIQMIENGVDLFFWVHTHGWTTPGIENVLQKCRNTGVKSFAYHLDLYMGLKREKQLRVDPFFTVDHFFTVDKLMADWLNENTSCKGHFLPAGVFEGECFLSEPNLNKYPHEIIFTGSTNYHPEYAYRTRLVNWLKSRYGDRFAHYGGGGLPTIRGKELNTLYASAKIVIGDTLCKDFTYPFYSSDRLFEVSGRGGFMIYPNIHGLSDFYSPGKEMVFYNYEDFAQLENLINYYLDNEVEREAIKTASFNRTLNDHTYTNRMQTILNTLSL